MNYYERHLGDYAKDTSHLSMSEHGAYNLLMDRYYATEKGIPEKLIYRIAKAQTKAEKNAVDFVINEFFELQDGLWIKSRIEKEISRAEKKIAAARKNGTKGGRPKEEHKTLNNQRSDKPSGLNRHNPEHNPTITQLKAHQTPDTSKEVIERGENLESSSAETSPPSEAESKPTPAGLICKSLKEMGVAGINTSHPNLLALIDAGATVDEFKSAATDAVNAGKPVFAYVLGVVKGRRADAKNTSETVKHGSLMIERPWFITTDGIEEKAAESDPPIVRGRDEHYPDWKARVLNQHGITGDMERKARNEFDR